MKQPLGELYKDSLGLLTDLYQLTMAYSHWKCGTADKEAVFNLSFRSNPFKGGFTVACGLMQVVDYVLKLHFDKSDIKYLSAVVGNNGAPLFETQFLDYLQGLKFNLDIDAVADGTVVFPHEPIVRVKGPIIECQLIESALLNLIGYHTLIATKAARLRIAAGQDQIIEFGLRRAHGIDGAVSASWAAFIGGCDATSNVLASKIYDIPIKGTHAHSWVMSFEDELSAFQAYAKAMPNNCVFLVDTYSSLDGINNAIKAGLSLSKNGQVLQGHTAGFWRSDLLKSRSEKTP